MAGGKKNGSALFDFDAKVTDITQWRRMYLLGEMALARADHDPAFRARLLAGLDRQLTDPDDRAAFSLSPNPPPEI